MVHSEVISKRKIGARTAGSSSGAQNAIAASRRSGVPGHSMSAAAARPGRAAASERDAASAGSDRRIGERAREIAAGAFQRMTAGAGADRRRIGQRRELGRQKPDGMRCDQDRADADRHPRRRRSEISGAPLVEQRRDAEPQQQEHRPVFAEHRGRCEQTRERGPAHAPLFIGAQEAERGRRPQRQQDGVGVELQRVEIEERNERHQHQGQRALLAVEIVAGEFPDDPERCARDRHRQQVERPVGDRKHREPRRDQPRRKRRVLRIAERKLARPRQHLDHVGVQVLARFRQHPIERPDRRHRRRARRPPSARAGRDRSTPRAGARRARPVGQAGEPWSCGIFCRIFAPQSRTLKAQPARRAGQIRQRAVSMARPRRRGPYARPCLSRRRTGHIVQPESRLARACRRPSHCSTRSGSSSLASCRERPAATSPMPPRGPSWSP